MAILKFGTRAPDIASLNTDTSQVAQNVLPRLDGYGPVKSPSRFSLPLVSGNDSVTKSLLHFDSSTPLDVASGVSTVVTWSNVGSVAVNSTVYKFGGFSYLFTGGAVEATSTEAAKMAIGSNNFAIDGWLAPTTSNGAYNVGGWANSANGSASTAFIVARLATGKMRFVMSDGTTSVIVTGSTNVINSTTFDHWAMAKKDNWVYLAVNGVLDAAPVSVSSTFSIPTVPYRWAWGHAGESSVNVFAGRQDENRVTIGDARFAFASTQTQGTTVFNVPPAAYGPLPNGVNRGFIYVRATDGSVALFAGTLNRLWKMDNSTLGWVDVSQSLSAGYTDLPATYNWTFAQYGSTVIACQPNTKPQVFTLGSSTQFADLSSDTNLPQAAYVGVIKSFVVLTGLTSFPFRVQWSDTPTSATGWTAGSSAAVTGSQTFQNGGIARGIAGGEYGVLFQDTNIRRMIVTNNNTSPFQFELLAEDLGLLAPYSVVRSGTDIYFLSNKGFYQITPTGLPVPIGVARFDKTFFDDYDNAQLQLIIGAADPESQRIAWAYKSGAAQSGLIDKVIIYDTILKNSSIISGLTLEYLGTLAAPGLTLDNLSLVYPNIDTMPFSLDNIALAAQPKLAMFDSTHALSLFTGLNLEATIDTPEVALDPQRRVRVRETRPITDASSCFVSIGGREHPMQAVTYNAEQAVDSITGHAPQNVATRLARGRLRIVAGTTWTYASGIEPDFVQMGKR